MSDQVELRKIPLDYDTLRSSGLLWKINHDVLHPLGIALAVDPLSDVGLVLSIIVADDGKWEFAPGIDEEYAIKFRNWQIENGVQFDAEA